VTNAAPIEVQGEGSVGIVALSAGGANSSDQSGTVTVNANANITASGSGGRAILVSSDSYKNQATGTVNINVNQGVTLQTGANGAETVLVLNGSETSTLTNAGTIIGGNAASNAIYVKSDNSFQIQNYGTITGSISGEADSVGGTYGFLSLDNNVGATLNTGSLINLPGAAGSFVSSGTISPGAQGTIANTTIQAGQMILLGSGSTYQPDLDASDEVGSGVVASDMLSLVPGTFAPGAGILQIEAAIVAPSMLISQPGKALKSGAAYVMDSAYNFVASDFTVQDTATVDYSLFTSSTVTSGSTTLVLDYSISTTPWNLPGAPAQLLSRVNSNHRSFGDYLNRLFFTPIEGVDDAFISSLAEDVLAIPDMASLLESYEDYIADEALAVPDATLLGSLAFSKDLHGCGSTDPAGASKLEQDTYCTRGRFYGRGLDYDPSAAGPTYTEQVLGLSLGIQTEFNGDMTLGGALDYESGDLTLGNGTGSVSRFMAGAMLKSDLGFMTLAGSLEGGSYSSTISRSFTVGGDDFTATGSPDGTWLAAHVRANSRFSQGDGFIDPTLDIGLTSLRQDSFVEQGADGFSMSVSELEQTTISINPFVTFGTSFLQDGMTGQFSLRAGVLGLVGQDPSVDASFVGVGASGPIFVIRNSQTNLFGDLGAAVDLSISDSLALRASADALVSDDQTSYSAQLVLNYSF